MRDGAAPTRSQQLGMAMAARAVGSGKVNASVVAQQMFEAVREQLFYICRLAAAHGRHPAVAQPDRPESARARTRRRIARRAARDDLRARHDALTPGRHPGAPAPRSTQVFKKHQETLPLPGSQLVVLDGARRPRVIVRITHVERRRIDQVDDRFAFNAGEGDLNLRGWLIAHRQDGAERGEQKGFEVGAPLDKVLEHLDVSGRRRTRDRRAPARRLDGRGGQPAGAASAAGCGRWVRRHRLRWRPGCPAARRRPSRPLTRRNRPA